MTLRLRCFAILFLLCCAAPVAAQTCRVVGYFPWWESDVSSIEYERLTNVLYFALEVTAAGDLVDSNINYTRLHAVRDRAHAAGASMGICVGGWLTNGGFSPMAADPTARAHFIGHVKDFCLDHHLDGVDLDWEPVETAADRDKLLTVAQGTERSTHAARKRYVGCGCGGIREHPLVGCAVRRLGCRDGLRHGLSALILGRCHVGASELARRLRVSCGETRAWGAVLRSQ